MEIMKNTAAALLDSSLDKCIERIINSLTSGKPFVLPVQVELSKMFKLLSNFERLLYQNGLYEERHPLVFALSDLKLHVSILAEYLKGNPVEKVEVVEMVDFCQAQLRQLIEIANEIELGSSSAVSNYSPL
jgi:hypothetical protein